MSDKPIGELREQLGKFVRETDRMLDNRCIDCGSHDVLIVRCRRCTEQHEREQRMYR